MTNVLSGVRGRVTFTVLAVSAVLFSLIGTLGFVQVANSGRDAIRERIDEVLDQLEGDLRAGIGTYSLSTADGVLASVDPAGERGGRGEIVVERTVDIRGNEVTLLGRSSQARLTDSLRSLYRGLWLAIPVATVATALMAGAATRRALRPVAAITDLADSIGADETSARVPVPNTGDEIEHLARTMNEMLARIERGRQMHRQFTSDAAHELRTPLMALQAELELVAGHPERVDVALLDRLDDLGHRLRTRIDDLVLLATLDEARPLELGQASLLQLAIDEATTTAPGVAVTGDDGHTRLDPMLVARAIRNLLTNARRHASKQVHVAVVTTGDRVWLHVDDDGIGIDPTRSAEVFGRFSRLDEARTADAGGSGLGLAIVASVAEAHGGGTSIGTAPLGGARVSLWIPLRADG